MPKVNITSPVGRIVDGSLYTPQTTDAEGKPLVYKTGANAGQPRTNYYFALAVAKGVEGHWANTAWGQQIWAVGHQFLPNAGQIGDNFAWKIEDGDSQQPNKKGRKPCEREGWAGNWIIKFSGSFAPKIYQQENGGYVQNMQPDFCKPGYFVEVAFSVEGNGSTTQPGVYLNHSMVCFRAFGQEISFGPDVNAAGFGASPLPVGASATPLPGAVPPPLPPGGSVPMPSAPAQAVPAPIPVMPNPQFVQVPPPMPPGAPAAGIPVPPPAPPAAPVHQMTAAANGITYEEYIAGGWTDALLVQHGMMLP